MSYAIKFLREELNRERAWMTRYQIAVSLGRYIEMERVADMSQRVRENRIQDLQQAIVVLKPLKKIRKKKKPLYYWLRK